MHDPALYLSQRSVRIRFSPADQGMHLCAWGKVHASLGGGYQPLFGKQYRGRIFWN